MGYFLSIFFVLKSMGLYYSPTIFTNCFRDPHITFLFCRLSKTTFPTEFTFFSVFNHYQSNLLFGNILNFGIIIPTTDDVRKKTAVSSIIVI